MFYRERHYDLGIGRFISEDPIGFEAGDLNVFRYALNDPVFFTDPSGTEYYILLYKALIYSAAMGATAYIIAPRLPYLYGDIERETFSRYMFWKSRYSGDRSCRFGCSNPGHGK